MAKQAIYGSQLTHDVMNGSASYRVKYSCGVFSIAAKVTHGARYWSAYKRASGRLFKVYVGKGGEVERHDVQSACVGLLTKIRAETGATYPRDNRARQVTQSGAKS